MFPFWPTLCFHCVNVFVAVSLCAFLRTSFVEVCPNLRSMFLALSEWEELGRHRCCICMLAFGTPYSFSCWWCCCCCLRALLRTAGPRNLRGPRHPKFRPCRCGLLQRLHPLKDQAKQKPERKTSNGIMPAPLQDLEIMSLAFASLAKLELCCSRCESHRKVESRVEAFSGCQALRRPKMTQGRSPTELASSRRS